MFSPYYAHARRRGVAAPENHCAINVALYGGGASRWSMTERGRDALGRDQTSLAIGPSTVSWDGTTLVLDIDEVAAPLPSRIRGQVRLHPFAVTDQIFALDAEDRHRWWPIAPSAHVEVEFDSPSIRWTGHGYFDSNAGTHPLEDAFDRWHWSRARLPGGTAILYDVVTRDEAARSLAIRFTERGRAEAFDPPPRTGLPGTFWRVARETRADAPHAATILQTLEDGPFYSRSILRSRLLREPVIAMHESLSLARFRKTWVRMLLPFRMPRVLR